MSRKKDSDKIKKIKNVMLKHPEGLWIREIARQSGLDKSTVSIYLNKHMKNDIENIFSVKGGLIKIVRLKK